MKDNCSYLENISDLPALAKVAYITSYTKEEKKKKNLSRNISKYKTKTMLSVNIILHHGRAKMKNISNTKQC